MRDQGERKGSCLLASRNLLGQSIYLCALLAGILAMDCESRPSNREIEHTILQQMGGQGGFFWLTPKEVSIAGWGKPVRDGNVLVHPFTARVSGSDWLRGTGGRTANAAEVYEFLLYRKSDSNRWVIRATKSIGEMRVGDD